MRARRSRPASRPSAAASSGAPRANHLQALRAVGAQHEAAELELVRRRGAHGPAIGVRQEPSRTVRKARSAASAWPVGAIEDRGKRFAHPRVLGADRDGDGPLPDGGQKIVGVENRGHVIGEPEAA